MEIPVHPHPSCSEVIAMKFCTCHDSTAVVACADMCKDMVPYNGVTLKLIFRRILIMMEKNVKGAQDRMY